MKSDYVFAGEHMRMSKQQTSLCIFLTTFILLLGMCFDCGQTDSFFSYCSAKLSYELIGQGSPVIESNDNISILSQICSGQIVGRQSQAALQQQVNRRSFRIRSSKGHSFAYFVIYILPMLLSSILISEAYDFMPDIRKSSIIIRYIQHKDGKKYPLSFS